MRYAVLRYQDTPGGLFRFDRTDCFGTSRAATLAQVSDSGSKKQAKMRNAEVSPPALQRPSLAGDFLRAVSTLSGSGRARDARTARSGAPTKRGRTFKMGVGGKLGNLADPRFGPVPLDHAPHRHSLIGTGRRRPHPARTSTPRHFSVDLQREMRSTIGDSVRKEAFGRGGV